MKKKLYKLTAILLTGALLLGGCGSAKGSKSSTDGVTQKAETSSKENADSKKAEAPKIDGLTYESTMDLTYAKEFDVFYYKGYQTAGSEHLYGCNCNYVII